MNYECSNCRARGVKLWRRKFGWEPLLCARCLEKIQPEHQKIDERGRIRIYDDITDDEFLVYLNGVLNYVCPAVPNGLGGLCGYIPPKDAYSKWVEMPTH